jgi:hypothetical protein
MRAVRKSMSMSATEWRAPGNEAINVIVLSL